MAIAPLETDTDLDIDQTFRELVGHQPAEDDGGEKDRFGHYVRKEDIVRAATEGIAVPALCGKLWKPSRNPEQYPVCKTCQEILDAAFPQD